jgi:hypothetical protein
MPTVQFTRFATPTPSLLEHDPFRKPVSTFRDHALRPSRVPEEVEEGGATPKAEIDLVEKRLKDLIDERERQR